MERTLGMIKPDAIEKRVVGEILARAEREGFRIVALRLVRMTRAEAEAFYAVHRSRGFFEELTGFMSSGPSIAMVLEADRAIQRWRDVMGATDPRAAAPGTLRSLYGTDIQRNAVHGSDAPATAATEIAYFFGAVDLLERR
jgi:nucleoside-diphosphate kinase